MLAQFTKIINAFRGLLESADQHRVGACFLLATGLLIVAAIYLIRHCGSSPTWESGPAASARRVPLLPWTSTRPNGDRDDQLLCRPSARAW